MPKIASAEKILGDNAWNLLEDGEVRLVGQCLKWLVDQRQLPLVHVLTKHEYPLHYRVMD